jgi:hypothetical protein
VNADTSASGAPSRAGARTTGTTGGRASQDARPAKATPAKAKAARAAEVTDEDIRVRAYFLSLEQGPAGGSELDCWIRAERELRGSSRGK